jgi:signal transduction histidine kinase
MRLTAPLRKAPDLIEPLRDPRTATERYAAIFNGTSDGIMVLSLSGLLIDSNAPARSLLGSQSLLSDVCFVNFVHDDDRQDAMGAIGEALTFGASASPRHMCINGLDSQERQVILTTMRLHDAEGHPSSLMLFLQEVLDSEVSPLSGALTASAETAHGIKNQIACLALSITAVEKDLAAIEEIATPLAQDSEDAPGPAIRARLLYARDALSHASTAVVRATELSVELMHLSSPCKKETRLLDVNMLLASMVMTFGGKKARDIEFSMKLDYTVPNITVDQVQLERALLNIIQNAIEAMPEGGTVTVATKNTQHGMEIHISDTGAGIPADILPRVFNPFVTTKGKEGNGIGLAIARRLVRNHDGDITVTSEPGNTAFTITLPFDPD